jgi:hypothetical protein
MEIFNNEMIEVNIIWLKTPRWIYSLGYHYKVAGPWVLTAHVHLALPQFALIVW